MSGIAGIARNSPTGVSVHSLGRMAAAIRHRGPDGYGFYTGKRVGFAHVQLGTSEVASSAQPCTNEDGSIVITANAELFNHPELRRELEERGHVFQTGCHAEILVHGYEEWGSALLSRLNGQFAFAIYDRNRETVFVARDRFGVRPLFYAQRNGDFFFGSEIKAILASGEVEPALDQRGLDEVFRLGTARAPRTTFSGIACLEPGTYGIWKDGAVWLRHYYELDYPESVEEPTDMIEQLDENLLRSVGMRMRADARVGAYLSGGLDSSITASLAKKASQNPLRTFSITYAVPEFDESLQQQETARAVGSLHTASVIGMDTVAQTLPEIVWHAETPVQRTDGALMYHLAKAAVESGVDVVIGAEGADEVFLGNVVFRETAVRRQLDPAELVDPLFSHLPRFRSTRVDDVYSREFKWALSGCDVVGELRASLPTRFFGWSPLNQAAYLEITSTLSPSLLGSHGDRMTTAHGVEGRYPFLDHRLFEFAASLPTGSHLRGLEGKEALRRWASRILPNDTAGGRLAAYPTSDAQCLFIPTAPSWVGDHLTNEALSRVGIFSHPAVSALIRRCRCGQTSDGENETLVAIVSTQLWYHEFVETSLLIPPLAASGAAVLLTEDDPDLSFRPSAIPTHADR